MKLDEIARAEPAIAPTEGLEGTTDMMFADDLMATGQTFQTFRQTFPSGAVGNVQTCQTGHTFRVGDGIYRYKGRTYGIGSLDRARTRSYPLVDFRPLGRGHEIDSGPDDCGKTALAVWSAARIVKGTTKGPWNGEPHDVMFILSEDTPGMIRSQMLAMGLTDEQLAHVHTLTMPDLETGAEPVDDCSDFTTPVLPGAVPMLAEMCRDNDIRFVVIDTLLDCIGGANSNSRDDMARVVAALNRWAQNDEILVVSIHHNIKGNDGTAKQAVAGAGTLTQKSRTVIAFDVDGDPRDPGGLHHYFQLPKLKGYEDHPSFEFTFEARRMTMDDGTEETVPYVAGVVPSDVRIDDLRARRRTDNEPPLDGDQKSEIAAELYAYILKNGKHMFTSDVQKWAEGRGWTAKMLRRSYNEAGVSYTKQRCPHPRSILYLNDPELYRDESITEPETAAQTWGTPPADTRTCGKSGKSGKSERSQGVLGGKSEGKSDAGTGL